MSANKVIPENLVRDVYLCKSEERLITVLQTPDSDLGNKGLCLVVLCFGNKGFLGSNGR